jgi:ribonuclease HI
MLKTLYHGYLVYSKPCSHTEAARAGGAMFSPRGNQELTFSWSLGKATNNQAEAYALLQGILLAKQHEFNSLIILGDLKVVINDVRKHSLLQDIIL